MKLRYEPGSPLFGNVLSSGVMDSKFIQRSVGICGIHTPK